ncbi:MAG: biopolymer transporter ExbD [Verrucomicrobiae bacterium]|nr:biopolymer transporter ExbD [Verrucomicrobiae bacterium]
MAKKRKVSILAYMGDDEDPEFQIAPMIDILLVLLIFFMSITSKEVMLRDREIQLANADNAEQKKKETDSGECVVNVKWTGFNSTFSVGEQECSVYELGLLLEQKKKLHETASRGRKLPFRVIVRADREVQWRFLQDVLKACAGAEINNITYAVLQEGAYAKGGT